MAIKTSPESPIVVKCEFSGLCLYKQKTSANFFVRFRHSGRYFRKTAGTDSRKAAEKIAIEYAREIALGAALSGKAGGKPARTFENVAADYIESEKSRVRLGEIRPATERTETLKLRNGLIPILRNTPIHDLDGDKAKTALSNLKQAGGLRHTTILRYRAILQKLLKFAEIKGYIPRAPEITLRSRESAIPRPHFDEDEYRKLRSTIRNIIKHSPMVRFCVKGHPERILHFDDEFIDFVVFHINSFLRPADLMNLRHRQVRPIHKDGMDVLEIDVEEGKTGRKLSITMRRAAEVYERLRKRHEAQGLPNAPDDFVFYPNWKNRSYAAEMIQRMFRHALTEAGLKQDRYGQERTIYSLRHSAFVFRLTKSDVDPVVLAKNGMTSVGMLEKYYLSGLKGRDNVGSIAGFRKPRS